MIWSHKMKYISNIKSSNNQRHSFFPSPFYYCYYLDISQFIAFIVIIAILSSGIKGALLVLNIGLSN